MNNSIVIEEVDILAERPPYDDVYLAFSYKNDAKCGKDLKEIARSSVVKFVNKYGKLPDKIYFNNNVIYLGPIS